MEDLLARWQGRAWQQETDAWVAEALAARGAALLGPGTEVKTRFWSAVRRYPSTLGTVWAKECNPGQAFEGPVLAALAALAPDDFPAPLAVDGSRGRVLLPDAGAVRPRGDRDVAEAELSDLLAHHAGVQQRLAGAGDRLREAGLPSLTTDELPAWVEDLADRLAALPPTDPQHLDRDGRRAVRDGLPAVRGWSEELAGAGLPSTFQHDDLNPWNVARGPRGPVCFDVGDAFWSHPFAVLHVPLAMATRTWPEGPPADDPYVRRVLAPYLDAWGGPHLHRLVGPALRLAHAHRCESWRRLLDHVPADRLGVPTPLLPEHLLRVVAPG